jgi:type IV secretion system protein VirB10
MNKHQIKLEEGLPEIAQTLSKKKPLVLSMLSIVFIICCSLIFFSKSSKQVSGPLEETYTVQQDNDVDALKVHSQPLPKVTVQSFDNTKVEIKQPPNPELIQEQIALIQAKQNELQQRLSAPLILVNTIHPNNVDKASPAVITSTDRNTQFMHQVSNETPETVTATTLGAMNYLIVEGSLIHATLESATNSDLPGFVRAIVSEPSYSEDGSTILIPSGSRLIGQYKSGMLQGQSRIFMVWTRLITPNGISIQLGSPGIDSLGGAGIGADDINRHFWERFGTGSLLSLLSAGAANAGVSTSDQENSASAYRAAVANSFAQSANQSLQQDSRIPPTLITYQGKSIIVFVAKDLNFQNTSRQTKPRINIF